MRPDDECVAAPMADGGEGTIDALAAGAPDAVRHELRVTGPVGDDVTATVLELPDGAWVVELAETSGIAYLDAVTRDTAATATTRGLGEAIRFALDHGAHRVLVGLGSSASTDGGAGALAALGAKLTDARGRDIAPGNAGLHDLDSLDLTNLVPPPPGGIVALTDVESPLLGPAGAAAVFGPQKGATPDDVARFDAGLARLAGLVGATADPDAPGAGAAGGAGFGLLITGARIRPGADEIAAAVHLETLVADADLVITGEGSFDAQSLAGKVPSTVLAAARAANVPMHVIAGRVEASAEFDASLRANPTVASTHSLTELAGSADAAMRDTARYLEAAATELARSLTDNTRQKATPQ